MISRLLVANRGEIARRVIRTAHLMGIASVAVFSDADASAPHVREADAAIRLPGATPTETYLRHDLLLAAAGESGADAVHPGYGFLSENAVFARAVATAGLTWVGPPGDAIEAMGDKLAAKQAMRAAGVPTLPWTTDPDAADEVGYPLLIKASAGGGGRGMRIVRTPEDLAGALDSARREAGAAFGDDTVFIERYVDDPRHVEIQVIGDAHGNVVSLFERECSIQRRHQKLVEEAPSPAVDDALRERMSTAAVAAARAVGYRNAGTVEFVLDRAGEFSFLEMNTRLQVEHPVTEAVTGLDLVRLQLLVADGRPLPPEALAPRIDGHAIEVRLVAEDVDRDFLPQSGALRDWAIPAVVAVGAGRRQAVTLDSGVEAGSEIPPFYDSMVAKVVAHAPTRAEAAAILARTLEDARIFGVTTNCDLLAGILREPDFLGGQTDTGYLTRHPPGELGGAAALSPDAVRLSAIAALLALQARNRAAATALGRLPSGWRNNPSQPHRVRLARDPDGGGAVAAEYAVHRDGWQVAIDGESHDVAVHAISRVDAGVDTGVDTGGTTTRWAVDLTVDGRRRHTRLTLTAPATGGVNVGGDIADVSTPIGSLTWHVLPRFREPGSVLAVGSLTAPMPGTVARVLTEAGATVTAGAALLVLEAMKMEHTISAPADGIVSALAVVAGQQVAAGALLAVIE